MLAACVGGRSKDPLAQIIARNTQARGGAAAIEQAKAVLIRMRIVEPKYTMDAVYRATRGGQMRIDVYMGGMRVYSEGCDGRRAWREEFDGINYHVLQLVLADGFTTYFYVNPHTWLIERQRDERALHPDADAAKQWIEQRFADYRTVEGRKVAFKQEQYDLRSGALLQTSSITQVETNPVLTPDEFAPP
jgi:hypothetical protein